MLVTANFFFRKNTSGHVTAGCACCLSVFRICDFGQENVREYMKKFAKNKVMSDVSEGQVHLSYVSFTPPPHMCAHARANAIDYMYSDAFVCARECGFVLE